MIKIDKGTEPEPEKYKKGEHKGKEKREVALQELEAKYASTGDVSYSDFKQPIYGYYSDALKAAQHNKCCYCERKEEGDVEHFRPKAKVSQGEGEPKQIGYFWLAYDWENFLFSCKICNQSYKKDYFPLADNTKRATPSSRNLSAEEPLLINPATENPEDFLDFEGEFIVAKDGNEKGKATIEYCGLDREPLNEARKESLDLLVYSELSLQAGMPVPETLQDLILKTLDVKQQFYAAKRAYYEKHIESLL